MDDILVYSIDEVFIDATPYLSTYNMTAHDFAMMLIQEVLKETRITATAGIGTNMYLAKIAMDIVAKHIPADKDGVRIAELNEMSYREKLWTHKPLTDFWRVGKGIARKLEQNGMFTMGDIARCSEGKDTDYYNEDLLYKLFGINAELLIDHAWGWEPTEIADCKAYKPESKCLSSGQVLSRPYSFDEGRIVLLEMADLLSMDLVRARLFTDQVVLDVGYDIENLTDSKRAVKYKSAITTDFYGRQVPKSAHGSKNLGLQTSSTAKIMDAVSLPITVPTDSDRKWFLYLRNRGLRILVQLRLVPMQAHQLCHKEYLSCGGCYFHPHTRINIEFFCAICIFILLRWPFFCPFSEKLQ